jgi:hypothetical protein
LQYLKYQDENNQKLKQWAGAFKMCGALGMKLLSIEKPIERDSLMKAFLSEQ